MVPGSTGVVGPSIGIDAGELPGTAANAGKAETPLETSNPSRTAKTAKNLNPRTRKETPKYPDGMGHRHLATIYQRGVGP